MGDLAPCPVRHLRGQYGGQLVLIIAAVCHQHAMHTGQRRSLLRDAGHLMTQHEHLNAGIGNLAGAVHALCRGGIE